MYCPESCGLCPEKESRNNTLATGTDCVKMTNEFACTANPACRWNPVYGECSWSWWEHGPKDEECYDDLNFRAFDEDAITGLVATALV